jgi:hypothetical protein
MVKAPRYLFALALMLLSGCSAPSPFPGSARLSVAPARDNEAPISRVSVTASAADFSSVTVDLAPSEEAWGGVIDNLPAGSDRSFLARAFDASGSLLVESVASGITIAAHQTALVTISLYAPPSSRQPSTQNRAPGIDFLAASSISVPVGTPISLVATAHDPDPEDTVSYAWTATCEGSWVDASTQKARFTPEALPADACDNCSVTLTVADGHGGKSSGTLALCVFAPPSQHSPPAIIHTTGSSDSARPGEVLTFEVVASDPESSALTFSWAANTGALGLAVNSTSTSRTTWTAPSCIPAGTVPTLTATVTNAFKLTATRSFAVMGLPACSFSATIRNASRTGEDECLIFSGHGTESYPLRYMWETGPSEWCGLSSREELLRNKQAVWAFLLIDTNQYIIMNASRTGVGECLIFGGNGHDTYPSRYMWGLGPSAWCGFPSKTDLLNNKQAVWTLRWIDTNRYVIANASRSGTDECLMFNADGLETHPSRYIWGDGPSTWCGLPSKEEVLNNKQAVWTITPLP